MAALVGLGAALIIGRLAGGGSAPLAVAAEPGVSPEIEAWVRGRLPALVAREVQAVEAAPDWLRARPTCVSAGGIPALHVSARPPTVAPLVVLTDRRLALDRPGASCQRVLGAAPQPGGVVLVSVAEVRSRCSSLPLGEAVARVAAHELGHALGATPHGADGLRCDARGCHCLDPDCLLADERGGCPAPDAQVCARCAARLRG